MNNYTSSTGNSDRRQTMFIFISEETEKTLDFLKKYYGEVTDDQIIQMVLEYFKKCMDGNK